MKKAEAVYLENAAPEQREAYLRLREEFSRRMLTLSLIWLAVTVCIIAVIADLAKDLPASGAVIWLISAICLSITVSVIGSRFTKRIRQTPELVPLHTDPQTLAAMEYADRAYAEEETRLRNERTSLLIGSFFLLPLMPVFLIIAILRAKNAKCAPASPYLLLENFAGSMTRMISGIAFAGTLVFFGMFIFSAMAQFTGKSHVSAMNSQAKMISRAAETYQLDLDASDEDPFYYGTYIFNSGSAEGGLYDGIRKYCNDCDRINFAIRFSSSGNVSEIWCSYRKHPLTEDELMPLTVDEQYEIAGNLLRRGNLIGYYRNEAEAIIRPE